MDLRRSFVPPSRLTVSTVREDTVMFAKAAVLLLAVPALALDPADSWLVYGKAAGGGAKVLSVNATWRVPAYPTTRGGGNAPGWWFGIEPNPADVLIQPILAYGV